MNKGENSARHKNKCFEAFSSSLYRDSNSYPFIHPHNTSTFAQHFKSASIFFCNVEKVWLCSSFVSLFVFLTLFFNQGFHWLLSFTTLSSLSGSKAGLLNSFFSSSLSHYLSNLFFNHPLFPRSSHPLLLSPVLFQTFTFFSCHVCIHEEPTTAPALSRSRLAQTHLQKPVLQTQGGWRVICCRRLGCA